MLGVKFGGLNNQIDIKFLICWLLKAIEKPISLEELTESLTKCSLVNYFELTMAFSELLNDKSIKKADNNKYINTENGNSISNEFENNIPLNVREEAIKSLKEILKYEKIKEENFTNIVKCTDGYKLELQLSDYNENLLDLNIYVPNEDLSYKMRDNFLKNPSEFYKIILDYLNR